jgi:hypothetical protein
MAIGQRQTEREQVEEAWRLIKEGASELRRAEKTERTEKMER